MTGSDIIVMNINIGGETLKLNTPFEQQGDVRDAEEAVKSFIGKLKHNWPNSSDKKLLAMAAYQFSFWFNELKKNNFQVLSLVNEQNLEIKSLIDACQSELDH